jgi:chorismate synthase
MQQKILEAKASGDSLGGVIQCHFYDVPSGLGDPVYEKLSAKLASAMLSIPACRGIEFGAGFNAKDMRGSEHNDTFTLDENNKVITRSNYAGGIVAGISNGMPISFKVVIKPTSSIKKEQNTLSFNREPTTFSMPENARHDPCIAVRAVAVVEAMAALTLVDSYLLSRMAKH